MVRFFFRYGVYVAGLAVFLVLIGIVWWVVYARGTAFSIPADNEPQIADTPVNRVRKITVTGNGGNDECIEITPDGLVRVYETCGGDLIDSYRSIDSQAISRLFRLISEGRYSRTMRDGLREVVVETDQGVYTYYLSEGDGETAYNPGINDLIDDIINDKPIELPTPTAPANPTPTFFVVTPGPTGSVMPSPTWSPPGVTPTPDGEKPFTCDFIDATTGKRPYRVSNVVCSSYPEPGQ